MKKYLFSLCIGMMSYQSVFAHDPGGQLIGSRVWKYTFFGLVYAFVVLILWRLITDYVAHKLAQKVLLGLVGLGALVLGGYFFYHRVLE